MNEWWQQAACRGLDTNDWYQDHEMSTARKICARCPVRRDCLAEASRLGDPCGVRGGLTAGERADAGFSVRHTSPYEETVRAQVLRMVGAGEDADRIASVTGRNADSIRRIGRRVRS